MGVIYPNKKHKYANNSTSRFILEKHIYVQEDVRLFILIPVLVATNKTIKAHQQFPQKNINYKS